MSTATLTLALPEVLYQRLERAALATKQSIEDIAIHALRLGSPPAWDDVPPAAILRWRGHPVPSP